jgi:excisionase family DNA binding protein
MSSNVIPLTPRPGPAGGDTASGISTGRNLDALPLLLAVPDAAKLLGISRSAAYRLANAGELPCCRLGGRIYVITAQLFEMVGAA